MNQETILTNAILVLPDGMLLGTVVLRGAVSQPSRSDGAIVLLKLER